MLGLPIFQEKSKKWNSMVCLFAFMYVQLLNIFFLFTPLMELFFFSFSFIREGGANGWTSSGFYGKVYESLSSFSSPHFFSSSSVWFPFA